MGRPEQRLGWPFLTIALNVNPTTWAVEHPVIENENTLTDEEYLWNRYTPIARWNRGASPQPLALFFNIFQLREEEPYRGPVTDLFVYSDYRLGNTTSSPGL
jgi:hypothetical protein